MTVNVTMDASNLTKELEMVVKNLPKELAIVASKTAKKTVSLIAKDITQKIAVPQKAVKKLIKVEKVDKTGSLVTLKPSDRLRLKEFKARQTKKGVTYKIEKGGKRKRIPNAFIVKSYSGNVYRRKHKKRGPLVPLYGVSPHGAFVKNKRQSHITRESRRELRKQMVERIRYKRLKQSGAI